MFLREAFHERNCVSALQCFASGLASSFPQKPKLSTMTKFFLSALDIHFFPTVPPKQPLRSPGFPGGQEGVKESMWCLLTSIEHQDDPSYL